MYSVINLLCYRHSFCQPIVVTSIKFYDFETVFNEDSCCVLFFCWLQLANISVASANVSNVFILYILYFLISNVMSIYDRFPSI